MLCVHKNGLIKILFIFYFSRHHDVAPVPEVVEDMKVCSRLQSLLVLSVDLAFLSLSLFCCVCFILFLSSFLLCQSECQS